MQLFKKKKLISRAGVPLIMRWTLLECRLFSIKVHKLISSDHSCQHDHPWTFFTFLLTGGYVEHTPNGSRVYSRFSLLYRPASYIHRLEIHQPVYTFVVTFKKVRQWGFITPLGWIPWFKFDDTNSCEQ